MNNNKLAFTPFRIAAWYALVSFVWLNVSDFLLHGIAADSLTQAWVGGAKNLAFALLSASLLHALVGHAGRQGGEAQTPGDQALAASQKQLGELTQRLLVQDQVTTRRLAQALHDDLGQRLFACTVMLEAEDGASDTAQLLAMHRQVLAQLQAAMKDLRSVLLDLRPPLLEDRGLIEALRHEIGRLPPHDARIDLQDLTHGQRWSSHIEYGAFMIAREALLNAIAHAQAGCIGIQVKGGGDALSVSVEDDGQGIPDELLVGRPGHLGITGMRERAASLGGQLRITSASAQGARVSLELTGVAS